MTSINSTVLSSTSVQAQQKKSLDQLASGKRVTSAADDATSLAIASQINSDAISLGQAAITASTGQALLSTAASGLDSVRNILGQLQSLAVTAQSGTASPADLANLNTQYTSLLGQLDNVASSTQFNGQSLLDGSSAFASGVNFQLGTQASDAVTVTLPTATSASLGLTGTSVDTSANASAALDAISSALATVSGDQAQIGATTDQFASTLNQITASQNADLASVSALTDGDVGASASSAATSDALSQANIAALVKKNHSTEHLLALLQQ